MKEENMDYKKPLTIDEQIEYLKKNKRIVFNQISEDEAKTILLKYGYINVISPFKYIFADKKNGIPVKVNGRHIYSRDVEFKEYYDNYLQERKQYERLYLNISKFEVKFNSIVTHELMLYYNINSDVQFNKFVNTIISNVHASSYRLSVQTHMINELNCFSSKMKNYESIYIFMDRLSLGSTITLFRCCDLRIRKQIFSDLLKNDATVKYTDFSTFDDFLFRVVPIRNCVFHNNSLTILKRYFDIKNKLLRTRSDQRKYSNIIKRLL